MIKVTMRSGNDSLNARESEFGKDVKEFKTIWDAIQFVVDETSFKITTDDILDAVRDHGAFYNRHYLYDHKWISIRIEEG